MLLSAQNGLLVMSGNRGTHLHIYYAYNIKMITGFHVQDNYLTWWEDISKLSQYSWMFKKEQCTVHENCVSCRKGGYVLIFTYA